MIKQLAEFILRQRLAKTDRKVHVNNLHSAESAGIIYDASVDGNELLVKELCKFLENQNIQAESIGLYLLKDTENMPMHSLQHFYISRKEVNFLKIPQGELVKKFIDKKYDLLFDCNLNRQFTLRYISTLSTAAFKVGPTGGYQQESCDMLIDIKADGSLQTFLEQAKHYLKIINNKKNELQSA